MWSLSAGERGGQGYVPIRNEDKPLPEGEEGGWKRKLPKPPTPRGLVGFCPNHWLYKHPVTCTAVWAP